MNGFSAKYTQKKMIVANSIELRIARVSVAPAYTPSNINGNAANSGITIIQPNYRFATTKTVANSCSAPLPRKNVNNHSQPAR